MKIDELFEAFNRINTSLGDEILEISVKKHQISIIIEDSLFYFPYVHALLKSTYNHNEAYVTTHQDRIIFTLGALSTGQLHEANMFYPLIELIEQFAEEICQCPSLEYVISKQYIKCFLDKPGLKLDDLKKYEEILSADGLGELEMHPQRPYLLFINENYEV